MELTPERKQKLEEIYSFFLHHELIQRMKEIPMHRGSNTYIHSFKVAKLAIKRALRHKKGNLENILLGAILHDYYLYDWRTDKSKMKKHGSAHPYIAAENAKNDFDATDEVQKIIKSHMWPINLKEFPNSKEARIVDWADDHIALLEFLTSKRFKEKRLEKTYKSIETLF